MNRTFLRGQLTTWNDDRGFGFIQPENGHQPVFVHISALKGMNRRPIVGDTLLYEVTEDDRGRLRANYAFLENFSFQKQRKARPYRSPKSRYDIFTAIIFTFLVIAVACILFIFVESTLPTTSPPIITMITKPGCVIKGNISVSNGNRNYHLPGMEDYGGTVIDPGKGEHWFCTEAEALAQGWKKAPR